MVNIKTLKQKMLLLFVGVFLAGFVMSVMPAPKVAADGMDGSFISSPVSGKVLDHQLLFFLERCFLLKDMDKVTSDELASWAWLHGGNINSNINFGTSPGLSSSVRGGMYDAVSPDCGDGQYIKEAFGRFGFTDALDTFCSLSFTYSRETGGNGKTVSGGNNTAACKNGYKKGDFDGSGSNENQLNALKSLLSSHSPYSTAKAPLTSAQEYVRYYRTFMKGCNIGLLSTYQEGAASGQANLFKVAVVNQDGTVGYYLGQSSGGKNDSTTVPLVAKLTYGEPPFQSVSCGDLAVALRPTSEGGKGYADAYSTYLKTVGANDAQDQSSGTSNDPGGTATPTSCAVDGIGWIICPVMGFIAKVNDSAFSFLQSFLGIRPSLINSDGTTKAWQAFRDIANVAFVIAFLVIVYSQLTSAGISNYGIKKMLPRIIIAAILVNVSYYICALMVDVSNILGSSIYSLLKSFDVGATGGDPSWQTMISGTDGILATAATGIAVVLLAIAIFLAPTTLLAFAVVILILIARQAFVILLIVVSPLAFVAYLLPNTEPWFKKWWKALVATLMVYPIIGAVFGASTLAANILSAEDSSLMRLIALGVLAVPLFAVPVLLKGALSSAGAIGQKIAGLQDRANRRAGKQVGNRAERIGNRVSATGVGLRNGEGFKRIFGDSGSRRRRLLSKPFTMGVDSEQKDKYAKISADAAARNYVAERASEDINYANKLAGGRLTPGSSGLGGLVQSYAIQAVREEREKDIKAERSKIEELPHEQLLTPDKKFDPAMSGTEMAAHAAEIAARGPGRQFHDALNASAQIDDLEKRQMVQKQLLSNMREDHFGLSDEDRGALNEGVYGQPRTDESGNTMPGITYEARLVERAGKKISGEKLAGLKKHDIETLAELADSDQLDNKALQGLADSIADAKSNENVYSKLTAESKVFHERIMQRATQKGISANPPPSQSGGASNTPGGGDDGTVISWS